MRVMSFNIRGTFQKDGDNVWPNRRALNIATIQKCAPGIIGFQEAQSGNLEAYAQSLPEYAYNLGPISVHKAADYESVPIFWRRDQFVLSRSGSFYLSETPEVWSIGWEAKLARAVNWVTLWDWQADQEITVLNTHFPYPLDIEETRDNCAKLIIERLAPLAENMPVIVMADFNAVPGTPAYNRFLKAGYVDTYTAAGHTEEINTYHGFKGDEHDQHGFRIDWILTKGALQTKGCIVVKDAAPPLYPSDHYPILAELERV